MSGVLSALVDNIPYVATMIPLVENMGETMGAVAVMPIWWSLALGSCFGGNGSLIGASANVVGAGISARSGYKISFLQFTKIRCGSDLCIPSYFHRLYLPVRIIKKPRPGKG
jgi:Na+/H+ antiporter NhaD/arsenite permease-like protein